MGKTFCAYILTIVCAFGILSASAQVNLQNGPEGKKLKKIREIKELKKEAGKKIIKDEKVRDEKGAIWTTGFSPEPIGAPLDSSRNFNDPRRQTEDAPLPNNPSGSIISSMNGIPYSGIVPPDPTLAVGPNHVIQLLNGTSGSLLQITNKAGAILIPATFLDQVTGIGGFADPIAIYDHLADRFVIIEMVNVNEMGSYGLTFAVTKTPDPTGGWDVYFLNTGSNLPDFPKMAMWPDAYYITANEFTNASSYAGTFVYAIDRTAILQGQVSPQAVRIRLGIQSKHVSACPVVLQGTPNGTAANGLIAWMQDDVWSTWDATDVDSVGLFKFNVNWSNPSLSTISNVVSIASAPFKSNVCTATRGRCIPQPGTTITLEALHQKVMNQPVYRSFSGFEGLVMAFTVDAANEQAGIRWVELRKPDISPNWTIGQQSTWSPDATHRFMPSISYNHRGDIALAYNVSDGGNTMPGLRFTGRRSCDPIGMMTVPEANIMAGTSYSASSRFGDYSHLVADPVNGNFWFTGQFMPSFQWASRIVQFRIDTCVQVCDVPTNLYVKNLTYKSATIAWTAATNINYYEVEYKLATESAWTSAGTTTADSLNLSNLSELQNYAWRIRSHCNFGNSLWINGSFSTPERICTVPSNTTTSQITISGARLSWSRIEEVIDYTLQYQVSGDSNWTDLPVTNADTVYNLTGLFPSTGYSWRVRAVCTQTLQSNWSTQTFTTPAEICNPPAGLQTTQVTPGSALLSWLLAGSSQVSNLEYQVAGAASWINIPLAPGTGQYSLSGLNEATTYNWRVRTACTFVQSNWVSQQFTTPLAPCLPPAGLTAADITAGSAQLTWNAVNRATSYRVEFQKAGASSWTLLTATATTNTAFLSGLSASTSYNWRVSATCPQNTTGFSQASFTTTASCAIPSSPKTTNIASTSVTLSWSSVRSIIGYRVEYKTASATSWTVMPNTTAISVNLTGLLPETAYQWRVRTICSVGPSAPTAIQNFTTPGPPCPDPYEPNNSNKALAPIPVNTDIYAAISTGTDQDWFSFRNTAAEPNIRITLSQLPADYSMTLYSSAGRSLVKAARSGLVNETISYNTTVVDTYWLQILPASSSAFNASKCYLLRVNIQSGTNAPEPDIITAVAPGVEADVKVENEMHGGNLKVYPNPARNMLFLQFEQSISGKSTAVITDQTGRRIREKVLSGASGEFIDVSNLPAGIYHIQVRTDKGMMVKKFMIKR